MKASRRSRHLLHRPQCSGGAAGRAAATGFMHDNVRPSGTRSSVAPPNHVLLGPGQKRRRDLDGVIESQRQRVLHRAEERRSRVRERIAGQRTHRDAIRALQRRDDPRLRQQHQVSPRQVDRFLRRVVGGWFAAKRPVRRRVHVVHRELDAHQRQHRPGDRFVPEKVLDHGQLQPFPGQPGKDVDRQHVRGLGFVRQQHGAVEAAGQKHDGERAIRWHGGGHHGGVGRILRSPVNGGRWCTPRGERCRREPSDQSLPLRCLHPDAAVPGVANQAQSPRCPDWNASCTDALA